MRAMPPLGLVFGKFGPWGWAEQQREILGDAGNLPQALFGELGRLRKPVFWAQNASSSVPARKVK